MPTSDPRPTHPRTDDATVLLHTEAIRRAAPARPAGPPVFPITARPAPAHSAPENATDQDDDAGEEPKFALNVTQVIASMCAAIVAAFIGAQLGVAGTIAGAAIASVVSVVGSAVIGHSLLVTRRKVSETVQHVRAGSSAEDETVLLTAVTDQDLVRAALHSSAASGSGPRPGGFPSRVERGRLTRRGSRAGRLRWVLVGLAVSVAVFAGALGAVTLVEAVKGAPISGGSSGFSVLGGNESDGSDGGTSSPSATVTETTTAPATSSEAGEPTAARPGAGTSAPAGTPGPSATGAPSITSSEPAAAGGVDASTPVPTG